MTFANDVTWFSGYESFYKEDDIETTDLSKVEPIWFEYVNNSMKPDLFKTDIISIIGQHEEINVVFEDRIRDVVLSDDRTTKDIGNLGEAIICGHEKMRLKINGYEEFIKLIQIVDSPNYHPGYDIVVLKLMVQNTIDILKLRQQSVSKKYRCMDFICLLMNGVLLVP